MHRRSVLAGMGTLGLVSLAGCVGFVRGDGPQEYGAGSVAVGSDAVTETGYELQEESELEVERDVSIAGITREVVVTNTYVEYAKTVDLDPIGSREAAIFSAIATPSVSILGRELNPVMDMSNREVAELVQDQYDDLGSLTHQTDRDASVGGEETTVGTFTSEAQLDGQPVELTLHISEAVDLGEDLVITVGAHPTLLDGEREHVLTLMNAVEAGP